MSSPRRPLLLETASAIDRLVGRERFSTFLRGLNLFSLNYTPDGRALRSVLRRVRAYRGKEPTQAELTAMVNRAAGLYTDVMVSLLTIKPGNERLYASGVDLELLGTLRRLRESGKGVILVSPHFGNLVLAMAALCGAGIPLHAQIISAGPYRWAEALGLRVVDLGLGAAQCAGALKRNEAVLLLPDLDFFPAGRTAEFFGAPVRPPHGVARLALYCGAPILPIYTVFEGGRNHVLCDEPLFPDGRTQEELESGILRSMETFIGRYPEHWFVGKDIWDIEGTDRSNRRHLRLINIHRQVRNLFKAG